MNINPINPAAVMVWMRFLSAAGIGFCLSSCADMESATQSLKGKDITAVVAKLGSVRN
jgi:hypothetical protein